MDISEIIITIFLLIAAFILLAIGVVLIFFGKRILRSASKKNIFMDNQDFDKINEDIHKIFDDFSNTINNMQDNQQNPNTQTSHSYHQTTSESKYYENTQNSSEKQPIPANRLDKLPDGNAIIKAGVVLFLSLSAFFAALLGASVLSYNVAKHFGLSEDAIYFIVFFIALAVIVFYACLFIVIREKFHKNLPQFFTKGTIAVKKLEPRRVRVNKHHYEWRNFCVLTIVLEDKTCMNFDTPPAIYDAVRKRDFVNVVYNKLSDNKFVIVKLNR